jgi:hypothetical protein
MIKAGQTYFQKHNLNLNNIGEKMTEKTNPGITSLLRFLTVVEVLVVFASGVGLFFIPTSAAALWPWELLPFNARFLGAVYSASCVSAVMQTAHGRWSPARLVTPMILVFTAVIMILSFAYLPLFDLQRWETWVWFALYIMIPVNCAWHLWLYRNLPPADPTPPSQTGRTILLAQAVILGMYGLALLIAPSIAKTVWSWKIDDFHAQMYSVTFLTPAIGAFILAKAASKTEWLTMGLTQAVLGLFPIIGVIIVDATVKAVNWASIGTWIWMALFAVMFIISLWMIKESRKSSEI